MSQSSDRWFHRMHGFFPWPALRGLPRSLFVGVLLVASFGCQPTDSTDVSDWTRGVPVEPGTAAEWAAIEAAQQARLEALSRFSSAGTLTLRWSDQDGEHMEQADHRLWRIAPERAAVRVSKVGSSLLLAGWNDARWWVLDETGEQRVLRIHDWSGLDSRSGADGLLSPPVFLAMLGLVSWPSEMPADFERAGERFRFTVAPIRWGSDQESLVVPGSLVVELGDPSDGPLRLELRDDRAGLVASAIQERFLPVETLGLPPGAWPQLPHRVRIFRPTGDAMVVSFDAPLAQGRISDRLFDLDVIIERSAPEVVEQARGGGRQP